MKCLNPTLALSKTIDNFEEMLIIIIKIVCEYYDVTPEDIQKRDRHGEFILVRHMIYYCARSYFGQSCPFSVIGYVVGGPENPYDHNSVRHGYHKILNALTAVTANGRYINDKLRYDYQVLRGNIIYNLYQYRKEKPEQSDRLAIWVGADIKTRLITHCKSTGVSMSQFAREAVIDALNNTQNGIQV